MQDVGEEIYGWVKDLFPIFRSLTGEGVRESFAYLKNIAPELEVKEVPSGSQAFDWVVPKEWIIKSAYIEDQSGNKIIDIKNNNLHVMGYSHSIDEWMSYQDLSNNLYSLPDFPTAIPYITSYYRRNWGFCVNESQREQLSKITGKLHVVIEAEHIDGVLNYGELFLKGSSSKEILLTSYICHPSMANNELSGPTVLTAIAKYLKNLEYRRYSYRLLYVPETIGSIVYLSKHRQALKKNVIAGYVLSCIGDDQNYSLLKSKADNTYSEKVAMQALKSLTENIKIYEFTDRGSDERQFCSPGVDLPIASLMRTKYGEFKEYHTSEDNLDFVSAKGLKGGYQMVKNCIDIFENDHCYKTTVFCEPQLGKRGLYPTTSTKNTKQIVQKMMDVLAYSDGTTSLLEISERTNSNIFELIEEAKKLYNAGLLEKES